MEETRKREADEEEDGVDATAAKKARAVVDEEETEEDVMAWLVTDESGEFAAHELRKLLEEEEEPSPIAANDVGANGNEIGDSALWCRSFRVRFIDDPYATPVVFQPSSSGYVTINGNEESCGSSFSDSDASVMASVDARGLFGIAAYFSGNGEVGAETERVPGEGGGAWDSSEKEARGWGGTSGVVGTDGWDRFDRVRDWDDDLLARFLGEDCL